MFWIIFTCHLFALRGNLHHTAFTVFYPLKKKELFHEERSTSAGVEEEEEDGDRRQEGGTLTSR